MADNAAADQYPVTNGIKGVKRSPPDEDSDSSIDVEIIESREGLTSIMPLSNPPMLRNRSSSQPDHSSKPTVSAQTNGTPKAMSQSPRSSGIKPRSVKFREKPTSNIYSYRSASNTPPHSAPTTKWRARSKTEPIFSPSHTFPKTKIVCTMGPNTTETQVANLLRAGMNIARINFSWGCREEHKKRLTMIRRVSAETRKLCAILVDTKGPMIRTGALKDGKNVVLKDGQIFTLTTDTRVIGDDKKVSVHYNKLCQKTLPGQQIVICGSHGSQVSHHSGSIRMTVTEVHPDSCEVKCLVDRGAELAENRRMVMKGVVLDLPVVTQNDVANIMFAVSQGVDFIGVSHVRCAKDIDTVRRIIQGKGVTQVQILARIETRQALDNIEKILESADGVVVSRGAINTDIPIEQVTLAQKEIIRKGNQIGKPVITASQILMSMIEHTEPTRAEATDVANAVLDGTDAIMLSAETTIGKHPLLAVRMLSNILIETEKSIDQRAHFNLNSMKVRRKLSTQESIASSAVKTSFDIDASCLLVLTKESEMTRLIAKYRPKCMVLCITDDPYTARQSFALRGVFPLLVGSMSGSDSLISRAIDIARDVLHLCQMGDRVVIAAGIRGMGDNEMDHVVRVQRVKW